VIGLDEVSRCGFESTCGVSGVFRRCFSASGLARPRNIEVIAFDVGVCIVYVSITNVRLFFQVLYSTISDLQYFSVLLARSPMYLSPQCIPKYKLAVQKLPQL
jgi:hypothetical protein